MLPRAGVAAERIDEVIRTSSTVNDPKAPVTEADHRGVIRFNHVDFRYPGAKEDVLSDIDFVAEPGKVTAIIGSTGCGKADASDEQIKKAADIAQASEFIETKNDGYESSIAQGGSNVSGGQKQRLAIARAIAKNPHIYVFDDSFSALDFKTDATLRKRLGEMTAKTHNTVLIVGQRIASIMHADQIIVLDEGKIVGKGTHEQLMKTCSVYQEIALSQLSKEELDNE